MSRPNRRSHFAAIILALSLVIEAGCRGPQPPADQIPVADTSEANLSAIRALHGSFMEAYNEADVETLAGLFTTDALRMPPNGASVEGEAAIRTDFSQLFADNEGEVSITVEETRLSGDFALSRGTWAVSLTPTGGGETTTDVGKWLNLLERQADGSWKISRNIWNSDRPAA